MRLFAAILALLALYPRPASAQRPTMFSISAVRAHLYRHETGQIDRVDITKDEAALWNTVVEISGPGFVTGTRGNVEVVVRAGGKTLLKQAVKLRDYFSEGTKVVVPFLVRGTGCERLDIAATLKEIPNTKLGVAHLEKTAPFKCSE